MVQQVVSFSLKVITQRVYNIFHFRRSVINCAQKYLCAKFHIWSLLWTMVKDAAGAKCPLITMDLDPAVVKAYPHVISVVVHWT